MSDYYLRPTVVRLKGGGRHDWSEFWSGFRGGLIIGIGVTAMLAALVQR